MLRDVLWYLLCSINQPVNIRTLSFSEYMLEEIEHIKRIGPLIKPNRFSIVVGIGNSFSEYLDIMSAVELNILNNERIPYLPILKEEPQAMHYWDYFSITRHKTYLPEQAEAVLFKRMLSIIRTLEQLDLDDQYNEFIMTRVDGLIKIGRVIAGALRDE